MQTCPITSEKDDECIIQNPSNVIEAFNNMVGFVSIPHPQISDKLYDGFLFPIDYLDKTQTRVLSKTVSDDLELIDSSSCSMYTHLCEPTHDFGRLVMPEMANSYTTNTGFLEDTQQVIHRMSVFERFGKKSKKTAGFWKNTLSWNTSSWRTWINLAHFSACIPSWISYRLCTVSHCLSSFCWCHSSS